MINTSSLLLATEKTGGLFDLDGTLPLVAVQFLVLMFLLNFILYTPLLTIIEERNNFIADNLKSSTVILSNANEIADIYKTELDKAKKIAQTEISIAQKLYKEILDIETRKSQKSIDDFLDVITNNFVVKKDQALASLEGEIDSLSTQIISKILS
jgi:F-type H+-transporting ATPase subunit b